MNKKLQIFRSIFDSRNYHLLVLTLTILLGIYKRYKPAVASRCISNIPAYWFIFNDSKLLIDPESDIKIPLGTNLKEFSILPLRTIYLGTLEDYPVYAVEVAEATAAPEGMAFEDLKLLYDVLDEDIFLLAGRAIQLITWDKNHQFCGKVDLFL